jgi:formiminotetrahydrofolate cyclodeaminase
MWEFCDEVASRSPAPAGVATAVVAADLGMSLLIKTLAITGKRPDLLERARAESATLRRTVQEDIAAVRELMRSGDARKATEVPMRAARSVAAGLDLCAQASGEIHGLLAADLGAAAALLSGAAQAIQICVDANLSASSETGRS